MGLDEYKKVLAQVATGRMISFRSTLTANNAEVFRPFFEELLKPEVSAIDIDYNLFKSSPRTTYTKLLDAMRWFCIHDEHSEKPLLTPDRRIDYMRLRATWHLEKFDTHMRIHKTKISHPVNYNNMRTLLDGTIALQRTVATEWRTDFMNYVQNAPEGGDPFIRKIELFTEEDRAFMKNICDQANIGWSYENGRLTAVK